MSILGMRERNYPGSEIITEQVLDAGSNYARSIVSYQSDGLKILALLTIPNGTKPPNGWPVIVFNHGYIPPEQYRTTERYIAYVDAFARNGYIVLKPDYRGHGESEGSPEGAYYAPAYTVDVLNALSSIKKHPEANLDRVGMWGHSLGGNITLRSIVVEPQAIKAAVIWGGVVGSYDDLVSRWHRAVPYRPSPRELALRNSSRQKIIEQYGSPSANLEFWNSIDPTAHIADIMAPVQLHHGTADEEVPLDFSESLYRKLQAAGKTAELFAYEGADHNISDPSFTTAMNRSLEFFDTYLK
ncbi:alpha/beta fold hydrolase [Candidatus Woesebacteria bacterium]|nr:alpha/beta fold hydrolase [Candidatus Woesebacteria bacterium]